MSQGEIVGPVEQSVGYVLKQATAALRAAMDAALRPLRLTVPQYACLELLEQKPGLSNAELARAGFVTRQSMNLVLRGLQDRGLLARADVADRGRARPTDLTPAGRQQLHSASVAVRAIERQMFSALTHGEQTRLLRDLTACAIAVSASSHDAANEQNR